MKTISLLKQQISKIPNKTLKEHNEDWSEYVVNENITISIWNVGVVDIIFRTMIIHSEPIKEHTDVTEVVNRLQRVIKCCEELNSIYKECGHYPPETEY